MRTAVKLVAATGLCLLVGGLPIWKLLLIVVCVIAYAEATYPLWLKLA